MLPELEALRKAVDRLQGIEANYQIAQKDLEDTKFSLAESNEAILEWQASRAAAQSSFWTACQAKSCSYGQQT